MIETETWKLGRASSAFVLAAALAILFNTALAWAKDAWHPLNQFMASLTGHHWTTHGLADLLLFCGLGLVFRKTGVAESFTARGLLVILVLAVGTGCIGLAAWYLLY